MRWALLLLLLGPPFLWWLTQASVAPVSPPPDAPVRSVPVDEPPKHVARTAGPAGEPDRVRGVGAEEPENRLRFLRTLRDDENSLYRRMALSNLGPLVGRDREVRRAIVLAAADPDAKVRALAISVLGGIAGIRPDAREVILRALSDSDRKVREKAAAFLCNLGEYGGARALESLFEQEWSGDGLDNLCSHVAEFGLVPDALERKPSRKVKALLIRHLCFETDNDHPEYAKALRGRYAELMRDFEPDTNTGWEEFFETAETGGDAYLIRDTALDLESKGPVRLGALAATIRREDNGRMFFDLYDRMMSGRRCSVEMREGLIEHLDTMRVTHPEHRDRVRGILKGLARDDPSKVVRAMALDYSSF